MFARLSLAVLLALPGLGVGVAAGEGDVPLVNPGIAVIEQIDVTSLPSPGQAGAQVKQHGPGPNAADIRQWGDANQLSAGQTSISPEVGGGSYFGVQRGAGNRASVVQDGVSLFAIQQQFGQSNTAKLFQRGANNEARLFQDGVQNHAEQIQIGNGLSSVIIQTNDNNSAVSQQIGDNLDPVIINQQGGAAVIVTVQAGAH